jgi:hypothetical protein
VSDSITVTPTQRDPVQHELKTWPAYFGAVASGRKSFEIRRDDRPFRTGDTLRLREWCPVERSYTGREVMAEVTYVMRKEEDFGLMDGFCLMGINVSGIPAATLAALRAGTHVVVPRERTEAMHQGAQSTTGAIITRRHSAEIWAAMLAASEPPA